MNRMIGWQTPTVVYKRFGAGTLQKKWSTALLPLICMRISGAITGAEFFGLPLRFFVSRWI